DARRRAVGRDVAGGPVPGERQTEEDGEADREQQAAPRTGEKRPPERAPPAAERDGDGQQPAGRERDRRDALQPCRPPAGGGLEPPPAEEDPERGGRSRGPAARGRARDAQRLLLPTFMPRNPGFLLRATKIRSRL